ncbi:MAG: hypothetical protein Q4C55_08730 [Eubacterium sp.]|nr:hypothetical protein [Eubacterium sp.]
MGRKRVFTIITIIFIGIVLFFILSTIYMLYNLGMFSDNIILDTFYLKWGVPFTMAELQVFVGSANQYMRLTLKTLNVVFNLAIYGVLGYMIYDIRKKLGKKTF